MPVEGGRSVPFGLSVYRQIRTISVMDQQPSRRRRAGGGLPIASGAVPATTEHGRA